MSFLLALGFTGCSSAGRQVDPSVDPLEGFEGDLIEVDEEAWLPFSVGSPYVRLARGSADRSLAAAPTAVDGFLSAAKLGVRFANLHAHHFTGVRVRGGGWLPLPQNGPCTGPGSGAGGGSMPYDDGRPCRADASGQNVFVMPPARADGSVDLVDFFKEACRYAKSDGGLDILYVTPHSKTGTDEGDTDSVESVYVDRQKTLKALNAEFGGKFFCGLGQEASSISTGNHLNILGHFPQDAAQPGKPYYFPSGAFDLLYPMIKARAAAGEKTILQLNHPDANQDLWWKPVAQLQARGGPKPKEMNNDYGLDDYAPVGCRIKARLAELGLATNSPQPPAGCTGAEADAIDLASLRATFANIKRAAGDRFRLIEIISPDGATSNPGTDFKRVENRAALDDAKLESGLRDWLFYLAMGLRLGPTANQDNHHSNFGNAISSRTGVLTPSLSEKDVVTALDARRVFASEDRNARIVFGAQFGASPARRPTLLMGGVADTTLAEASILVGYQDPDADDAEAEVRIHGYRATDQLNFERGADPAALRRLLTVQKADRLAWPGPAGEPAPSGAPLRLKSGEMRRLRLPIAPGGQYLFIEVVQAKDFDKAWSAPIWINRR